MSLKSFAAKIFASRIKRKIDAWASHPIETQEKVFKFLIDAAQYTNFGNDHHFDKIHSHEDFVREVPIRDYEELRPYIDRVVAGESDIVWPGKPLYFAKTSGTTSGAKYIPLTKESMRTHPDTARNAILCYIAETGKTSFVDGKMIFLQGSPEVEEKNGIKLGRLSGIVAHYVPNYLQKNRLPSLKTNCIDDWETKVDAIVKETIDQDMTIISGIPSWVQMYFEKLIEKSNKPVGELFKNFNLFIYGGVNYEPYRAKFENLIGRRVDSIELYPASEGFFAFQDDQSEPGLLLNSHSGIFFEFVPADEIHNENPSRFSLKDIEVGVNYAIIINSNAGLWGYNIGDTVKFVSKDPYRLVVTGRIKHFISAFGEHVIGKEVEESLQSAARTEGVRVVEFTVAPQVSPPNGETPYHEWFIEFEKMPTDLSAFAKKVDQQMEQQNIYYEDLIKGKILQTLKITPLQKDAFRNLMKARGKLGGQNKVPRLSNDRELADELQGYLL